MQDELVQFAQKAIIIKDNKLLIIKKTTVDKINPNKYDLPGGRKQISESLDDQIKRELMEELGLEISPKEIFSMWQFNVLTPKGVNQTVVAVSRFCDLITNEIHITEKIIAGYEWVDIGENLLKRNFIPGVKTVIEKLIKTYK